MTRAQRQAWSYRGINVYPASMNSSGIAWSCFTPDAWRNAPPVLRATTKETMRDAIRRYAPRGAR